MQYLVILHQAISCVCVCVWQQLHSQHDCAVMSNAVIGYKKYKCPAEASKCVGEAEHCEPEATLVGERIVYRLYYLDFVNICT